MDFLIARDLGMTLAQVRGLPYGEIVEWKAFYAVQRQQEELEYLKSKHGFKH